MGQKKAKRRRRIKRKKPIDPRQTPISIGGPLKITRADGSVEIIPASPEFRNIGKKNYLGSEYRKPRPRKY